MGASATHLPLADRVDRVQQHQDVQREVVADQVADGQFHGHGGRDDRPDREPCSQHETEHHRADVAERVQHAVAVVLERDRGFAVAVDHHVGVLEHLPTRLEHDRGDQSQTDRHTPRPASARPARAGRRTGTRGSRARTCTSRSGAANCPSC